MNTSTVARKSGEKTATQTSGEDRRRRPRLASDAAGYLLAEDAPDGAEPTTVRVQDVSRLGVGFIAPQEIPIGAACRIRVGDGPMRLARRMRVQRCQSRGPGEFLIGAQFE